MSKRVLDQRVINRYTPHYFEHDLSSTGDAIVITPPDKTTGYTVYKDSMKVHWIQPTTNTVSTPTIKVLGLGNLYVRSFTGGAISAGDLVAGRCYEAMVNTGCTEAWVHGVANNNVMEADNGTFPGTGDEVWTYAYARANLQNGVYWLAGNEVGGNNTTWGLKNLGISKSDIYNWGTLLVAKTSNAIMLEYKPHVVNGDEPYAGASATWYMDDTGSPNWSYQVDHNKQIWDGRKPVATETSVNLVEIASDEEVLAGTIDDHHVVNPAKLRKFVDSYGPLRIEKIALGDTYNTSMALTKEGKVVVWGTSNCGATATGGANVDVYGFNEVFLPDYAASNVSDLRTTGRDMYVLFENGNLYGWGRNVYGQLGLGDTTQRNYPELLLTNVSELHTVECASYNVDYAHVFAKKMDGTYWGCGANEFGRMGDGSTADILSWTQVAVPAGHTNITKLWNLGYGYGKTYIEVEDGKVYGCGYNGCGSLGIGNATSQATWAEITALAGETLKDVQGGFGHYNASSCSESTTVFLTESGKVYTCGDNNWGQLGQNVATVTDVHTPTDIGLTGVSEIRSFGGGPMSAIALYPAKDKISVWGYNSYGQLGLGNNTNQIATTDITVDYDTVWANTSGHTYSYVSQFYLVKTNGEVWAAGDNGNGVLCVGDSTDRNVLTKTYIKDDIKQIHIGGYGDGGHFALFLTVDGRLYGSGYNGRRGISGTYNFQLQDYNPYPRRML